MWTDETLLDRLASADGAHVAIVDGDVRLTVDDLRARSASFAGALAEMGVGPGDVVAWQLPNWWEAVVVVLGGLALRRDRQPDHADAARAARSASSSGRPARGSRSSAARSGAPTTPRCCVEAGFDGSVIEVRRRRARCRRLRSACPRSTVGVDDPAVILWTSGTTSDPKGVVHTHQSLRVEADTIAAAHDMRPGEPLLLPMPVTHVAGLTYGVLLPVTSAITAVLMDVWEPGRALDLVGARTHRGDDQHAGVHAHDGRPSRRSRGTDVSSVRLFSLGGAGVAPAMVREGAAAFGCWCKRTYGSTEYPTLTTGRLGDAPELDATTDGRLIDRAELRIVDPETLVDVAPGTPGELLARGPEMFVGYLDPALDAESFVPGGWFRTGDLARFDGDAPHDRRPVEGRHHPGRREHLRAGGRGVARDASRRSPRPRASPRPTRSWARRCART